MPGVVYKLAIITSAHYQCYYLMVLFASAAHTRILRNTKGHSLNTLINHYYCVHVMLREYVTALTNLNVFLINKTLYSF